MPDDSQAAPPDFAAGVPLASVPEGGLLAGTVREEPVILTRSGAEVRAFAGRCTHLGAPLADGLVFDGTVRCPWHHACFDLESGRATAAPAFDALVAWAVERDGDRVRVTQRRPVAARPLTRSDVPRIVIVGGGAAGYAAAFALRREGFEGAVTLVSSDTREPYDRTLLTKDYLDGRFGDDRLPIAATTLADLGVAVMTGTTVAAIDRGGKAVVLAGGTRLPYDQLLLATGAEPRRLDVPGAALPHVGVLRTVDDCQALLGRLRSARHVVVIGGSFIGLEAAASIRSRDLDVTVVTPKARPMAKIVGDAVSEAILAVHRDKGVRFRLGAKVVGIEHQAVLLADGSRLPADAVVIGIGVTPRVALAEAAGLAIDDGVVVDAHLRTSDPDIHAAGDIAAWPDPHSGKRIRVEHWVVAQRQGEAAAASMAGQARPFTDVPFFWSKHFDFSFRYVGHADGWDTIRIEGNLAERKAVLHYAKDGRDCAALTVGRDKAALEIEQTMERHAD